jgi:hypothetical protein
VSLERVFFARNPASALKLGQARGVALLAAAEHEISVFEYSAAEIKVAVTGFGQATKQQVQKMITVLLCLRGEVAVDAADALAAAICHIQRRDFSAQARRRPDSWQSVALADYLEIAGKIGASPRHRPAAAGRFRLKSRVSESEESKASGPWSL